MKPLHNYISLFFCLAVLLLAGMRAGAQDTTKKDLLVNIGFYNIDNKAAYLAVHAKTKTNGKFLPVRGIAFRLYLDKDSATYATGDLVTNDKGEGRAALSPLLKDQWNASATHTFIAVSEGNAAFNPSRTETPFGKAHLLIDTGQGRTVDVTVLELKNGVWTPAKAVDIKVAVKRFDGDLPVSDKESYTTDSSGKIEAEFKRDGLPGDRKGLLTLVAKVEDNDLYGNLQVEKSVPWGSSFVKSDFNFNGRTLWGTRFKTPVWLLLMAYSIIISVWSVIIYLIVQIVKLKRMDAEV